MVVLFQWVYILDVVYQAIAWCNLPNVDPVLWAEVTLRLALIFEASASTEVLPKGI